MRALWHKRMLPGKESDKLLASKGAKSALHEVDAVFDDR